MNFLKKIES